jgi:hypothetical protein
MDALATHMIFQRAIENALRTLARRNPVAVSASDVARIASASIARRQLLPGMTAKSIETQCRPLAAGRLRRRYG